MAMFQRFRVLRLNGAAGITCYDGRCKGTDSEGKCALDGQPCPNKLPHLPERDE